MTLVRNILGAKKCLFAAGPGAYMAAYVCATGGKLLHVLNDEEQKGAPLDITALCLTNIDDTTGTHSYDGNVRSRTKRSERDALLVSSRDSSP